MGICAVLDCNKPLSPSNDEVMYWDELELKKMIDEMLTMNDLEMLNSLNELY